jgi:hypothetical protein
MRHRAAELARFHRPIVGFVATLGENLDVDTSWTPFDHEERG